MNTVRLNITLPKKLAEEFKDVKSKSAFIAKAIEEYTKKQKKEETIKELREGYKAIRKEDAEVTADWESATGDGID